MEFVRLVLLFLHLLGMAVLVGSFLLQRRTAPRGPLSAGWLHGALLQLVTGLALVGVNEAQDADLIHAKVGVKLLVLVAILGLVLFARRQGGGTAGTDRSEDTGTLATWVVPALAGLVVLNVGIAVFWT